MNNVQGVCRSCNATFNYEEGTGRKGKFCSRSCYYNYKKQQSNEENNGDCCHKPRWIRALFTHFIAIVIALLLFTWAIVPEMPFEVIPGVVIFSIVELLGTYRHYVGAAMAIWFVFWLYRQYK